MNSMILFSKRMFFEVESEAWLPGGIDKSADSGLAESVGLLCKTNKKERKFWCHSGSRCRHHVYRSKASSSQWVWASEDPCQSDFTKLARQASDRLRFQAIQSNKASLDFWYHQSNLAPSALVADLSQVFWKIQAVQAFLQRAFLSFQSLLGYIRLDPKSCCVIADCRNV